MTWSKQSISALTKKWAALNSALIWKMWAALNSALIFQNVNSDQIRSQFKLKKHQYS